MNMILCIGNKDDYCYKMGEKEKKLEIEDQLKIIKSRQYRYNKHI